MSKLNKMNGSTPKSNNNQTNNRDPTSRAIRDSGSVLDNAPLMMENKPKLSTPIMTSNVRPEPTNNTLLVGRADSWAEEMNREDDSTRDEDDRRSGSASQDDEDDAASHASLEVEESPARETEYIDRTPLRKPVDSSLSRGPRKASTLQPNPRPPIPSPKEEKQEQKYRPFMLCEDDECAECNTYVDAVEYYGKQGGDAAVISASAYVPILMHAPHSRDTVNHAANDPAVAGGKLGGTTFEGKYPPRNNGKPAHRENGADNRSKPGNSKPIPQGGNRNGRSLLRQDGQVETKRPPMPKDERLKVFISELYSQKVTDDLTLLLSSGNFAKRMSFLSNLCGEDDKSMHASILRCAIGILTLNTHVSNLVLLQGKLVSAFI